MKIAMLSDIHANLAALEATAADIDRWQPDYVIVGGDVVNRGPRPRECLDFVRARARTQGWQCIIGNHEEYVLYHAQPDAVRRGPDFDVRRISYWTYEQLNGDVSVIGAWPFQHSLRVNGSGELRAVHASMLGTRSGIHAATSDAELRVKIAPPPAVLIAGHTHLPLIRRVDDTLVVNAGSVGLPFDGDRRAGYARLTLHDNGWQAEIVRLDYDYDRADRDFEDTDFLSGAGPLAELIRDEFRCARSNLFEWSSRYQAEVMAGVLTLEEAARRYWADRS